MGRDAMMRRLLVVIGKAQKLCLAPFRTYEDQAERRPVGELSGWHGDARQAGNVDYRYRRFQNERAAEQRRDHLHRLWKHQTVEVVRRHHPGEDAQVLITQCIELVQIWRLSRILQRLLQLW